MRRIPGRSATLDVFWLLCFALLTAAVLRAQNPVADARYVNVTGDTMTGALNLPADGLAAGSNQLILTGSMVGVGTAAPQALLHVFGSEPVSVPSGNGTNAFDGFIARAGKGGATTDSTANGGDGGDVGLQAGDGGPNNLAGVSPGQGSSLALFRGPGAKSTGVGGQGGNVEIVGGNGGDSNPGFGGRGGSILIRPGAGGSGGGPTGNVILAHLGGKVTIGAVLLPGTSPTVKVHIAGGDTYLSDPGKGIILKSPNGFVCSKLSIDNGGALLVGVVACP